MKLPTSPEIKRVITAVKNAGVEIGSVSITANGITISSVAAAQGIELTPYEKWKAGQSK